MMDLWAARQGSEGFPDRVVTQSGTTCNVHQMFDAVAMHHSVSVFITHSGAGSFYEGLYAGKRLSVFSFFGDQFPNAHNVEHNGLGVHLDHQLNIDGVLQKNVNRYKALIQIHSRHGCLRAADLIEKVMSVDKQGRYSDNIYSHLLDCIRS
ncbi:hypothetical protein MAM1_0227d08365 [Mucor ambiguus]|uniref:UDP-glycosyltransferases domain-containing protein n=1 Tax=Mucor ambiguus TaxID=91626 RepID=A0A0C9N2M3_9FUNG|nr:hypothetical protein MAM1_0227d08365 [Mucor ambiguus]